MNVVLAFERFVSVPVPDALAHRISAVKELNEADTAFDEPAGEHTIARKAGLQAVRIVHAVEFQRGLALLAQVSHLRRAQLHPGGEFVRGDAGAQVSVAGMAREMAFIYQ